jgi:hypothetical protein
MFDRVCLNPLTWLDITAYSAPGENTIQFSQCIRSWGGNECVLATIPLADACKMNVEDLRDLPSAKKAREQVVSRGLTDWCATCPRLREGQSPTMLCGEVNWDSLPSTWTILNLAYDKSCNLACPSCRPFPILWKPCDEQYDMLMEFQDRIIRPLLKQANTACLAGLGDPFGSPVYRHLLETLNPEDAPTLGWHIQTNGVGFTPDQLGRIPTRTQINSVQFSIDAAKPKTYRVVRGNHWKVVNDNLRFAGHLRQSGFISQLAISMVIQECNWGEMVDFYRLGRHVGCDIVQFNALLNQHTYSEEDYKARAVHLSGHPVQPKFMKVCDEMRAWTEPRVLLEFPRD